MSPSSGGLAAPDRWEVGSEFHWMGLPPGPLIAWPTPSAWYLLGRYAVVDLLETLESFGGRLWLPAYFCHEIRDYWRRFFKIEEYVDDPRRPEPDWPTLRPAADHAVLVVNYFGVRPGEPWRRWREANACILIEDHSHDPVSGWALRSTADYVFSSLRKTLPVPDGAILWSPRGLPLPEAKLPPPDYSGSAMKLAAMLWKREYLAGRAPASIKPLYREWQRAGETEFDRNQQVLGATPYSRQYLAAGVPVRWRRQRAANVRQLLAQAQNWPGAQPLFRSWPRDSVPLGAVFCFPSGEERDRLRKHLEDSNIYCPVHWPVSIDSSPAVRELADTILTIPADQRYRRSDMDLVAAALMR